MPGQIDIKGGRNVAEGAFTCGGRRRRVVRRIRSYPTEAVEVRVRPRRGAG